jgi:hypothetical protein
MDGKASKDDIIQALKQVSFFSRIQQQGTCLSRRMQPIAFLRKGLSSWAVLIVLDIYVLLV